MPPFCLVEPDSFSCDRMRDHSFTYLTGMQTTSIVPVEINATGSQILLDPRLIIRLESVLPRSAHSLTTMQIIDVSHLPADEPVAQLRVQVLQHLATVHNRRFSTLRRRNRAIEKYPAGPFMSVGQLVMKRELKRLRILGRRINLSGDLRSW